MHCISIIYQLPIYYLCTTYHLPIYYLSIIYLLPINYLLSCSLATIFFNSDSPSMVYRGSVDWCLLLLFSNFAWATVSSWDQNLLCSSNIRTKIEGASSPQKPFWHFDIAFCVWAFSIKLVDGSDQNNIYVVVLVHT